MHLAEDLCLVLTPGRTLEFPARHGTQLALAGAVLIERALDGDSRVTPDTVGELIIEAVDGLYVRVLDSLTEQGALRKSRSFWARVQTNMWFRWELHDHERRNALIALLTRVLRGHVEVDAWTGPLLALLYELNDLELLHEVGEEDWARAEEFTKAQWAPDSAVEDIGEVVAACLEEIWRPRE